MSTKIIHRIILTVIAILALIPISFFTLLLGLFSIHADFYAYFIPIVAILLAAWLIVWATGKVKGKYMRISFFAIVGAAVISLSGCYIHQHRIDSTPALAEKVENHLYDYLPFGEDTKVVSLSKPSTLRLTGDLPSMNGATALYPLYAAFVRATYPHPDEMEFPFQLTDTVNGERVYDDLDSFYSLYDGHIRGGTTPNAYRSLITGKSDVIFCARPSKEQLAAIEATGLQLHMTPIGREAFVFFVNSRNPVNGITQQQIRDIYSGKLTNWREVGGVDDEIKAFQRPQGSGSQTMLLHIMGDTEVVPAPREKTIGGMGGIIWQTANYRNHQNAIGYSFHFFTTGMIANNQIKLLEIDGIRPDKRTIRNGTYPFTGDFYAITLGEPKPNVKKLIDWILSDEGQELVEKTGYVSITGALTSSSNP